MTSLEEVPDFLNNNELRDDGDHEIHPHCLLPSCQTRLRESVISRHLCTFSFLLLKSEVFLIDFQFDGQKKVCGADEIKIFLQHIK